jgi:transposase-like protein
MSLLSQKHLQDEEAAYAWVEAHVWPDGPVCPHCGERHRLSKMKGAATRTALYKCYACRKQFNVKVGTIFEKSHVPMHLWLQAFYLICGSKKGISSNQLHRTLGVTLKTAWFMGHRIREAMRAGSLSPPLGGAGSSGIVEADETYFGKVKEPMKTRTSGRPFKNKGNQGPANKRPVLALLERGGDVRTFHIARADKETVADLAKANISHEARLMTDESKLYRGLKVKSHERVRHAANEYARGDVTTNHVEGYFSVFKRGMKGVYQHCSEKHLHRYLAEFDFRFNNRIGRGIDDAGRATQAIKGVSGKRLTYRTAGNRAE